MSSFYKDTKTDCLNMWLDSQKQDILKSKELQKKNQSEFNFEIKMNLLYQILCA